MIKKIFILLAFFVAAYAFWYGYTYKHRKYIQDIKRATESYKLHNEAKIKELLKEISIEMK
jgi:hypothetical protein